MPKYFEFKVAGYYLYFTSLCIVECMHVHASDKKLTESSSAKFFVKSNGDTEVRNRGILSDLEIRKIQKFIKEYYRDMYIKWALYSNKGYYGEGYQTADIENVFSLSEKLLKQPLPSYPVLI